MQVLGIETTKLPTEPIETMLHVDSAPLSGSKGTWRYQPSTEKFDPAKHLKIEEPQWTRKLSDFGYNDETDGECSFAASAPFSLFTNEAIKIMRNDLLSAPVQENYSFSTGRSPYCVRGYVPECSQFMYDAWMHPRVLETFSKIVGIELVPTCDYEIGHANIQLGPRGKEGVKDLTDTPTPPLPPTEKLEAGEYDDRPIDDWHYDYVPFVAVLMASDTRGMIGGETAVQCKDGSIQVIPGPELGKVVLMQGSQLKHSALRSTNCSERIAFVTSLKPKNPLLPDTIRIDWARDSGASNMALLGHQYILHVLSNIEARCKEKRRKLEESGKDAVLQDEMISFGKDTSSYLEKAISDLFGTISTT